MAHRVPFVDPQVVRRRRHPSAVAMGAAASPPHGTAGTAGTAAAAAVVAFEADWAAYCGTSHAVAVASGGDAVRLSLAAAGVGRGDEVVTVANAPEATAAAIVGVGADPVFVDVDAVTGCMDPWAFDAAVSPRTTAVVPVHLHGCPAPIDEIAAVALRHGLLVVEDAGEAHGATSLGRRTGALGDLGCAGFSARSSLGVVGGGGVVTTDSGDLAESLRRLRDQGTRPYPFEGSGRRSHLPGFVAAELREALPHLGSANAARRLVADRYAELLADLDELVLPAGVPGEEHVFLHYVVRTEERDRLRSVLEAAGIGTGLHDAMPLHRRAPFRRGDISTAALPVTDWWARHALALPMYPGLADADLEAVAAGVHAALRVATAA